MLKNKIAVMSLTLCVSLYGFAGLWINIGNETIKPALFISIVTAAAVALGLMIASAYLCSKESMHSNIVKKSIGCLIVSVTCFTVFVLSLINGDHIATGNLYTLINGVLFAFILISTVYTVSFALLSVLKRERK